MLTLQWLKNVDHVVYGKEDETIPLLSRNLKMPDLGEKIRQFRENPVKEGIVLKGGNRSSVRVFIPDLYFEERLDMGENVWLYQGDLLPAYCLYTPWEEDPA